MKMAGRLISYTTVSGTSPTPAVPSMPYLIFLPLIDQVRQEAFCQAADANQVRPQLR
jgi:hypothetical protein